MKAEIISIGAELLIGDIVDTNQRWLSQQLTVLGYIVQRRVTVPDEATAIQDTVKEALSRAEVVVTIGGLGPTSDDVTRPSVAKLLGQKMEENRETLQHIADFFAARGRPMPEATRTQAQVPERARTLRNAHGTAPGLVFPLKPNPFGESDSEGMVIMLPGPPRELYPMVTDQLLPLLQKEMPPATSYSSRTLKTTGLGESNVEAMLAPVLKPYVASGLQVGYCARPGEVDVRLSARGETGKELVDQAEQLVRGQLGELIYGSDQDRLDEIVVQTLTARQQTLAVAESCTGGYIAHRITNIPGASAVFLAGLVTYSNTAKTRLLGVRETTLTEHGAVNRETAIEMAQGARDNHEADIGMAVTGIAGPGGGSEEKPVGTVFMAVATSTETVVEHHLNPYDRETFKSITSQQAFQLIRRSLEPTP